MEAIERQALRVVRLLGEEDAQRILAMTGAEQEYFLVDKSQLAHRLDLALCGRTLFGAKPPKGQEMEDHYYGNIKDRIMNFMRAVL